MRVCEGGMREDGKAQTTNGLSGELAAWRLTDKGFRGAKGGKSWTLPGPVNSPVWGGGTDEGLMERGGL